MHPFRGVVSAREMRPEVVVDVHTLTDDFPHQFEGEVQLFKKELLLQYSVDPLGHGVGVRVVGFGHAGLDSVLAQQPLVGIRAVLYPSVGVVDECLVGVSAVGIGHPKSLEGTLRVQALRQVVADNLLGVCVCDERQIHVACPVADIGDVGHPDLFGTHDLETGNQVLVLVETVMGIGRDMVAPMRDDEHVVGPEYVEETVPADSYTLELVAEHEVEFAGADPRHPFPYAQNHRHGLGGPLSASVFSPHAPVVLLSAYPEQPADAAD